MCTSIFISVFFFLAIVHIPVSQARSEFVRKGYVRENTIRVCLIIWNYGN